MITINVMGGLGNQLFMVFATLAYGIQHNVKVVFPCHNCYGERGTYWDNLFSNLILFTTLHPTNISEAERSQFPGYPEGGFSYRPIPDLGGGNVCLQGYYQSPKYFAGVQSTIYKLMNLYDKQAKVLEKYSNLFSGAKEIVSMHFRLGDYKYKQDYHPVMRYEYFEGALRHIISARPDVSRVLYFCENEDNEFVRQQIQQMNDKWPGLEFIKVDDQIPDYEQLLVMSCCKHNIIANSTFSWWGAYFNENPNKIVCYPSVWFGHKYTGVSTTDLIPDGWVKIEA